MAYNCPHDLDGFLPHLGKPDTKFRQHLGQDLLNFLAEPSNSITCQDIGQLVDGLIPWMQSSNYKVSSNGIEVMTYLADRLGTDFRPYLSTVLPAVIDRLGDAKDTVREKAQLLILKLLERSVLTPQQLLEKLTPGFSHKNAKIREEVLRCLVNTLNEHGSQSISLSKFIPSIVKLLSDPTATVRDTAFSTVVELYKHIGERLRLDLQRKNLVPAARLPVLLARFDEVRDAGEMLHSAMASDLAREVDEIDRVVMPKPAIPLKKIPPTSAMKRTASAQSRAGGVISSSNSAGAVDEDSFTNAFEDVPATQIFSCREMNEQVNTIRELIADPNKDWNKRVDALKKLRSLVMAGATSYEDFSTLLRNLELPLQTSVKDLRSQVVREACITISYFSTVLRSKFDHAAETLLPSLINLIQNSAKVMASAGHIAVRFIIQHTPSSRLIPIITNNLANHKSKDIRRSCCEFLELMLSLWTTHTLERHILLIQDALKKGIADADPDARISSRKAFGGFQNHFPDQAEILLQSLEPTYRRVLYGELCLSSSSSSGSLAQPSTVSTSSTVSRAPRQPYRAPQPPGSASGSTENLNQSGLHRAPSLPRSYRQRSGIPVLTKDNSTKRAGFRSNSAIDLQAAQRAKARAQYAALSRHKITSGTASLPRPRKSPEVHTVVSPERTGRTRSRSSGVSQSQPTSRSGSPSSRLSYATYGRLDHHESPRPRRLSSGIPRSTAGSRDTSRETSPTRGRLGSRGALGGSTGVGSRPPLSPASRPVMAQRILQQSLEAESALADALTFDTLDSSEFSRLNSARKPLRSLDNHSDDSETSSVCSERSFDSFRRPSDDIQEIIANCASTIWQERKEGLLSLQNYLNNGNPLSRTDLKRITEIFTKMFMDSHTKVLSMFLDTLNELILKHRLDLHDWLYVLLQRIFNKLGTETLNSLHKKILKTLDVIKACFPTDRQLECIYRFLVDNTQTPNVKVKVAVLSYLRDVAKITEPSQFVYQPPANQALGKIIAYTQDSKAVEIRNAAKACIIALFNCNTPQVAMMLGELSKQHQEIASQIVHSHLRKSSSGSEPGSPVVGGSPKMLSPQTPNIAGDAINQEEIYKSLRRTTAEIQNYSFEGIGISKLERDKDTTSQDSGISQMSAGNDNRPDLCGLEDCMEELNLRTNYVGVGLGVRSGSISLPPTSTGTAATNSHSALPYTVNGITEVDSNGCAIEDLKEHDVIKNVIDMKTLELDELEKRKILGQLYKLIKYRHVQLVIENFKLLLRILLELLEKPDYRMQLLVLIILTEIFKTEELKPCYINFIELLTLKILVAHKDSHKEVVRCAELCAAAMAVCPLDLVMDVLAPIITTSEYPVNHAAIKMLTKLLEHHKNEILDSHLAAIMPGLIQAYDHKESPVRKCAVFCMVTIHSAVGEDRMAPYLTNLAGSKQKLLHLYIKRAQQGSSVPTSPKNSAAS